VIDNRFPWTSIATAEPQLADDFATRAIEKANQLRARRRHTKIAFTATASFVVLAMLIWMRPAAHNPVTVAQSPAFSTNGSNNEDTDLLAIMMPDARPDQRFDGYYGPAGWQTYASWDPISTDAYR
jgi:hypothetical protein